MERDPRVARIWHDRRKSQKRIISQSSSARIGKPPRTRESQTGVTVPPPNRSVAAGVLPCRSPLPDVSDHDPFDQYKVEGISEGPEMNWGCSTASDQCGRINRSEAVCSVGQERGRRGKQEMSGQSMTGRTAPRGLGLGILFLVFKGTQDKCRFDRERGDWRGFRRPYIALVSIRLDDLTGVIEPSHKQERDNDSESVSDSGDR